MNILVTSWIHHPHRKRGLAAVALVLSLLLSACDAPTRPATLPTSQPPEAEPAIRNGFDTPAATQPKPQSAIRNLQQAAYNYNRYHALAPDDLLGLKRLTEVCAALEQAGVEDPSCQEATERVIRDSLFAIRNLHEELEARTDDRRIVAESLSVPMEDVELGPNLVENGGFEVWKERRPEGWAWSNMATGDPWNKGVFVGGSDMLNGYDRCAGRVDGLWLQQRPDKEAGRCGYWYAAKIPLNPDTLYLVTFNYRTARRGSERAGLWLSYQQCNLFAGDCFLPNTGGKWRQFVVVGWNKPGEASAIQPLLRSWGSGEFELGAVALIYQNKCFGKKAL